MPQDIKQLIRERFTPGARQERLAGEERGREAEKQAKLAEVQARLNDPTSEESKRAQEGIGRLFPSLKDRTSGLSANQIMNFKVGELGKAEAEAGSKYKQATDVAKINAAATQNRTEQRGQEVQGRFNTEQTRKANAEVRSKAMMVQNQLMPELRKLNDAVRGAEALKDQANLSTINPIARGSLGFLAARTAGSNSQLSDKERETFTKAGGAPQKAQQAVRDMIDGTLIPEMSANYKAWIVVMKQRAAQQAKELKKVGAKRVRALYRPEQLEGIEVEQFFDIDEPQSGSSMLSPEKQARLQELRRKKAEGTLK